MHSSGEYYSILTVCETNKTWKCEFDLESNPSEPQPLLNDFIIYNLLVHQMVLRIKYRHLKWKIFQYSLRVEKID